jgi:hypothetical protein
MNEVQETPLQSFQRLRPALVDAAVRVFAASLFAREACVRDAAELPGWLQSGLFWPMPAVTARCASPKQPCRRAGAARRARAVPKRGR